MKLLQLDRYQVVGGRERKRWYQHSKVEWNRFQLYFKH